MEAERVENANVTFGDKVKFKEEAALTTGTGEATRFVEEALPFSSNLHAQ